MSTKKRLGRALSDMGVEALLFDDSNYAQKGQIQYINIDEISANLNQPRKTFNNESLEELSDSIKEHGIIQPIVVTEKSPNHFEIIAGERRFRASKLAGLTEIPAIVKNIDDLAAESLAIIENIQREDLNPLDQAQAYARLVDIYKLSHDEIASRVKKSRSSVTNMLRLMKLHPEAQALLKERKLDMGHARTLLSAPYEQQPILAKTIVEKKLSVRQVEELLRSKPTAPRPRKRPHWLVQHLHKQDIKAAVRGTEERGSITLRYESPHDLQNILKLLAQESEKVS